MERTIKVFNKNEANNINKLGLFNAEILKFNNKKIFLK